MSTNYGHKITNISLRFMILICRMMACILITTCNIERAEGKAHYQLTSQERWVVQRVGHGQEADFQQYRKGSKKTISARFLASLLSNALKSEYKSKPDAQLLKNFKVHRHGIRLRYVEIVSDDQKPFDHSFSYDNVLESIDTPYYTDLDHCTFRFADFSNSHFRDGLDLSFGTFVGDSDFSFMKVDGNALFQGVTFQGPVDFEGVEVTGGLDASEAKFLFKGIPGSKAHTPAYFRGLKVKADAQWSEAEFSAAPNFLDAHIDGSLNMEKVHFNDTSRPTILDNMKIGVSAYFNDCYFYGPTEFLRTDVSKNVEVSGTHFASVDFTGMNVGDTIFVKDMAFARRLRLKGLTYKYISANASPKTNEKLKRSIDNDVDASNFNGPNAIDTIVKIINYSDYSADIYTTLETSLRLQGYTEQADNVFIEHKRRERQFSLHPYHWPWVRNLLQEVLTRYGLDPHRTTFVGMALVLFGCLVFRGRNMEYRSASPQEDSKVIDKPRYYNILYSLDLFLPLVDLQVEKQWQPVAKCRFAKRYKEIHEISGWLVVGLAALAAFVG